MAQKNKPFYGIIVCLLLAIPAWFTGKQFPIIGGPVFGILLGMIFAPYISPKMMEGVRFTSKKILQLSIILLGFEMNMSHIFKVGGQSLQVMLFTLTASFFVAYAVGKMLRINYNTTILIGVGTSICGGSAIAATAPTIGANDDEVAHAISTIFLFNVLAVFIFPPIGKLLGLSDLGFGMWAGTAINDTSSVVAAASAWSNAVGNDAALSYATVVKLTRTLMIVPITLALSFLTVYKSKQSNHNFSFVKVFPWFIIGFLVAAIINSTGLFPPEASHFLGQSGKFFIIMAMVAIGLNTHLKKLIANGVKPILLGLACWFAVAFVSILVQKSMQLL